MSYDNVAAFLTKLQQQNLLKEAEVPQTFARFIQSDDVIGSVIQLVLEATVDEDRDVFEQLLTLLGLDLSAPQTSIVHALWGRIVGCIYYTEDVISIYSGAQHDANLVVSAATSEKRVKISKSRYLELLKLKEYFGDQDEAAHKLEPQKFAPRTVVEAKVQEEQELQHIIKQEAARKALLATQYNEVIAMDGVKVLAQIDLAGDKVSQISKVLAQHERKSSEKYQQKIKTDTADEAHRMKIAHLNQKYENEEEMKRQALIMEQLGQQIKEEDTQLQGLRATLEMQLRTVKATDQVQQVVHKMKIQK